ncbi:MAG: FAD-binding oxidoreductase [Rhodospirillaceae bacterium]|nr:FAD-binding oxidoreductase [Rhodospirillaceae bacterium]MBT5514338.1 FAD-binding oxidoreductase [Rhodospirillaceae bacterium]MBT6085151.1 FAD-binding oxidoreductase [Rhodospirillaceae bacterium]MBT6607957.1 FAD-binding oxidoreductase [Rhodospirillaceae bacterium]
MSGAYDAIIIGGGLLGSAIGFGLARQGLGCVILDEGDTAYRAARGNFGLVWVQSKGIGKPVYADWTMGSAELWPGFAQELTERTGIDISYYAPGGIEICLSEAEFDERAQKMASLTGHQNGRFSHQMLDRKAMMERLPGLGPDVVGGSFSPHDGHVGPLFLMRAMQRAFVDLDGVIRTDSRVHAIKRDGDGFSVETPGGTVTGGKVVLAAGLGNKALAPMVNLDQPVYPLKGQVLVTERMAPFLDMPTTHARQTGEGTILIGSSQEDVGFDLSSGPEVIKRIADRARRCFPVLSKARIVRTWAALRVMTPDGIPIYDQSETMPGAFAASCHSGVTLAATHAMTFAKYVADGHLGSELDGLSAGRFDV